MSTTQATPSALPIISIEPYVNRLTSTDAERQAVSDALHVACRDYGFFYLDVSSVASAEETDRLLDLARQFFALPQEEKDKISIRNEDNARGGKADNHEAIDIYRPVPDPDKTKPLWGTNQWPAGIPNFEETYDAWGGKMRELGARVIEAMGYGMKMNRGEVQELLKQVEDSFWYFRVIGYPPLPNDEDGFSCGAHRDYGCLTLLLTDPTKGALQVFLLKKDGTADSPEQEPPIGLPKEEGDEKGTWIYADPVPGCLVCNIGEMWEVWTRGMYKATLHRVIHRGSNYRVSLPFFFEPNLNAVIKPLPAAVRLQAEAREVVDESKYQAVDYGEFLRRKVGSNFSDETPGLGSEADYGSTHRIRLSGKDAETDGRNIKNARRIVSSAPLKMAPKNRNITRSAPRRNALPSGYVADPSVGPMLQFQRSLPKLPVPTLASTAAKYLETVEPLVTPQEFTATKKAVEQFVSSEQGNELQKRLLARAADGRPSWLSDWWNEVAYMGYRDPVVVFVSYFYVHVDDALRGDIVSRAASLVKALLPFRELVETQQLAPEKVRGIPIDMSSYKWLFNSSRYPVKPSDTARKFDPNTNNHVVFVRKNKFFEVPVVIDGVELGTKELEAQIAEIIELAGPHPGPAVGALTSENRDIWTDARETLIKASPINAESLGRIESAIVVVALDDTTPFEREEVSRACWVGNGRNRFYDKHQLIVFENGKSGFLGEHSCMDGTPTLRLNEFILSSLQHNKINHGSETVRQNLPSPKELTFKLDAATKKNIAEAEKHFDELVGAHDLEVLHYGNFGKNEIKKFKVSPDAWAQLVKQLAFHKMEKRPGVCYESAQTRKFQLGRTEVIRSVSNESKAFAEAMLNPGETDAHRAALFRKAAARHIQYAAWAADGQGVDRHLFGLKKLLKPGEPVPAIYTDKSYSKSNHWELSTSNLSSEYLDGWGYGEVVPDGFGLSYSIGDHYLRWTITSRTGRSAELKEHLAEAATELREMMERVAKAEATEKAKL
ncbi:Carnitine O-acetyltransferase mitochondrial [Tulasnella sp. 403]|nr:Carnitine O-acetyltransferase mitochondrial [Tulasnella sp. 403]